MTLTEILAEIDLKIRQKTASGSINPLDVAQCLEDTARYAYYAHPLPFFPTDDGQRNGVISSTDFIGVEIEKIEGDGYTLIKDIQFTKDPAAPNVVFIDGNSIPPNNIVLIQFA